MRQRPWGRPRAAAFQPARRRVQQAVDLDTLTAELLAVVEQTMQPASVSLWLRPSAGAPLSAR